MNFVELQQNELTKVLEQLHSQIDKSYLPVQQSGYAIDQNRQKVYESAEQLTSQLQDISAELNALIKEVNGSEKGQEETDLGLITEILNSHLNSLQWADQAIYELSNSVALAEKSTATNYQQQERLNRQ